MYHLKVYECSFFSNSFCPVSLCNFTLGKWLLTLGGVHHRQLVAKIKTRH